MSRLADVFRNDKQVCSIDLRHNRLKALDEEFFTSLYCNQTLLNLDLRENEIPTQDLKKVALSLLKNVDIVRKSEIVCNPNWFVNEVLFLSPEEWPILTKNLIMASGTSERGESNSVMSQHQAASIFDENSYFTFKARGLTQNSFTAKNEVR